MRPGRKTFRLKLLSRTLVLGEHTLVMGVLNVTPDSFSNRGKFLDPVAAIEHALAMEAVGRDRKSTRLNSSHMSISYAVFCLKKKKKIQTILHSRTTLICIT